MKFRNGFKIGLVLAVFVLLCSSASWADWNEVFYDDFDDGEYDGWTVTNWKGETRPAPDVVPSPEGYSLRGVGSGYSTPPPVDAWISHPVSISDVTEMKIEMRAKSGPQWPNRAAVYLVSSSDCYVFDDYGEAGENETADLQFYINGLWDFLHRYPIGSRAFEWHTFAWTRDANGWWSLSIDGQVEAANFGQDNRLTSFDRVGIMVMRNQSEIEWVRISAVTEPPETDSDGDGIPDEEDPDDDNDGFNDWLEELIGTDQFDENAVPDLDDIEGTTISVAENLALAVGVEKSLLRKIEELRQIADDAKESYEHAKSLMNTIDGLYNAGQISFEDLHTIKSLVVKFLPTREGIYSYELDNGYIRHIFTFNEWQMIEMEEAPFKAQPYANWMIDKVWTLADGMGSSLGKLIGGFKLAFDTSRMASVALKDGQDELTIVIKSRTDEGGIWALEFLDRLANIWKKLTGK